MLMHLLNGNKIVFGENHCIGVRVGHGYRLYRNGRILICIKMNGESDTAVVSPVLPSRPEVSVKTWLKLNQDIT